MATLTRQMYPPVLAALGPTLLVAGAMLIGWPIAAGGWSTFLDNPAHVAELTRLASEPGAGWTRDAYLGFDITLFHSPLLYRSASLLIRAGAGVGYVYGTACLAGFVAPVLSVYFIARRRLAPIPATLLAALLFFQPETMVGYQSPLGGMWPFGLALAGTTGVMGQLGQHRPRGPCEIARLALLIGFTLQLHMLATLLIGVVFLAYAAMWLCCRPVPRTDFLSDILSGALGLVMSAGFLLPFIAQRRFFVLPTLTAPRSMVVREFFGWVGHQHAVAIATPILALIAAGIVGAIIAVRERDLAAQLACSVAATCILVLLVGVASLGAYATRLLPLAHIAFAIMAVPCTACVWHRAPRRCRYALVTITGFGLLTAAIGWGRVVATHVQPLDGAAFTEVRTLWSWLRTHRSAAWGAVYFQDTYGLPAWGSVVGHSHVLALSSIMSGVAQVGAYYQSFLPPTSRWTDAELGRLFGRLPTGPADVARVADELDAAGADHLVLADPALRRWFVTGSTFIELARTKHFTILVRRGASASLCEPSPSIRVVRQRRREPGHIELEVVGSAPGGRVSVRESYHPFWHLHGGGAVARGARDLIEIRDLSAGTSRLRLRYEPPQWPWAISGVALLGSLLLGVGARRR